MWVELYQFLLIRKEGVWAYVCERERERERERDIERDRGREREKITGLVGGDAPTWVYLN